MYRHLTLTNANISRDEITVYMNTESRHLTLTNIILPKTMIDHATKMFVTHLQIVTTSSCLTTLTNNEYLQRLQHSFLSPLYRNFFAGYKDRRKTKKK